MHSHLSGATPINPNPGGLPTPPTRMPLSVMSQVFLVFHDLPPPLFLPFTCPLLFPPHDPVTFWESVMVSKYLRPCLCENAFLSLHIWWTAWLGLISPFYWSFGKVNGKMIYLIKIERPPKHEITFLPFPHLIMTLQEATFGLQLLRSIRVGKQS